MYQWIVKGLVAHSLRRIGRTERTIGWKNTRTCARKTNNRAQVRWSRRPESLASRTRDRMHEVSSNLSRITRPCARSLRMATWLIATGKRSKLSSDRWRLLEPVQAIIQIRAYPGIDHSHRMTLKVTIRRIGCGLRKHSHNNRVMIQARTTPCSRTKIMATRTSFPHLSAEVWIMERLWARGR